MKYIYLSIFLIALSCGTNGSKRTTKETEKELTVEVKDTKSNTKTEEASRGVMEELVVVLKNPKEITTAKALIKNSGLKWEKLVVDQSTLKIGLIKVPAGKKQFWKDRLAQADEFKSVELNDTAIINRIIEKENQSFLTMRKTPCFGDCPTYQVTIDKEGNVIFEGEKHTLLKGKKEFKLTDKEFSTLKQKIEKSSFNSLKNTYDNPKITDLPSTFVKHNGKEVQIRIWKDVPVSLSDVHEYVESILLAKELIK